MRSQPSNPILQSVATLFRPAQEREQLSQLAAILQISVDEVARILDDPRLSYHRFTIKKKSGGRRQIFAPSGPLKKVQRQLLRNYLVEQPVHNSAVAFRRGFSVADHANRHLGRQIVLTVDLKEFFASTKKQRVRDYFLQRGWSNNATKILLRLTTYHGGLPQGAPTSPALSNILNYELDEKLSNAVMQTRGVYSRYCDDLAFSWSLPDEPAGFRRSTAELLASFGYQIQFDKGWRLQQPDRGVQMPGVVLERNRVRASDDVLATIKRLKSVWFKTPQLRQRLVGYRGYLMMLKRKRWW